MKPIKLIFAGIHSYIDTQQIDFSKIHGVFGVIGPTGSGKSTILDAICLALYDRIPRFGGPRFQDSFINPGVEEAFVSFQFQLKVKGKKEIYSVERSYKNQITDDNRGKVSPNNRRLIHHQQEDMPIGESLVALFNKQVEALIGLNYEDFVRTVILPQNQFDEFLLLANKDRQAALGRIFHLEAHEKVGIRSREISRELQGIKDNLTEQKNMIGDKTQVTLEKLTTEKNKMEGLASSLEKDKIRTTSELNILTDISKFWVEQVTDEAKLKKLAKQKDSINSQKEILEKGELVLPILPNLLRKNEYKERDKIILLDIEKKQIEQAALGEKLNLAQDLAKSMGIEKAEKTPIWQQRLVVLERASKLQGDISKKNKERDGYIKNYQQLEKVRGKKEALAAVHQENMTKSQAKMGDLEKNIKGFSISLSDRKALQTALLMEGKLTSHNENIDIQVTEKQRLENEIAKYEQEKKELNLEARSIEIEAGACEVLEKEIHLLETENKKQMAIQTMEHYLRIHEPCPVCGEVFTGVSKIAMKETPIDEWTSQESELATRRKKLATRENTFIQTTTTNQVMFDTAEKEIKKIKHILEKHQIDGDMTKKELEAFCLANHFVFMGATDVEKTWQMQELEKEGLELEQEKLKKDIDTWVLESTKTKEEMQAMTIEIEKIMTQGKETRKFLDELEIDLKLISTAENFNPLEEIKSITMNIQTTELAETNAVKERNQLKESKEIIDLSLAGLLKQQETIHQIVAEETVVVDNWIAINQVSEIEIKKWQISREKINTLQKVIDTYNEEVTQLERQIKKLVDKTRSTTQEATSEQLLQVRAALIHVEDNIGKNREAIGSLARDIEGEKEGIKKLSIIDSNLLKTQKELDIYLDLSSLFRGNAFVRYVAGKQLSYITTDASKRLLKMTKGQYKLALKGSDFFVEDLLSGGIHRHPSTLSGGEKFLVSLCLALSLSARLQLSSGAEMEFFFLDEGFGSLDAQSTTDALEALFALEAAEEILVGLITHKESIVEALTSVIYIQPASESGIGSQVIQN